MRVKKRYSIFVVGIFLFSSFIAGAVTFSNDDLLIKNDRIFVSEPYFEKNDDFLNVELVESDSYLLEEGKPIIPIISKIYAFPAGTIIDSYHVNIEYNDYFLTEKICPSPKPVSFSNQEYFDGSLYDLDEDVYSSSEFYPSEVYSVNSGAGLKDGEHVIYFVVNCFAQYSPGLNLIKIPEMIDIEIEYLLPDVSLFVADQYDLLIITDESFISDLQPLVDHKNSIGVNTIMESVQDIYSSYNGLDEQEDIKLRIKDAIEEWGVKYVLLAGGRKGQTLNWYIPERLSNNGGSFESGYASDLYYADIYKIEDNEFVFENWDSNGNGVIAEFSNFAGGRDVIDYYPDVSVGRLPFRYESEIEVVVDKIIDYENNADDSWFKKIVFIAGDGAPPARGYSHGIYEDELECDFISSFFEGEGFEIEKLYTSLGTFAGKDDVINAISGGSGFVHMSGHGNPGYWGNFLPDGETEDDMVDGLQLKDMRLLSNGDELPIITVGGCHNAQFNVSMMNIIDGIRKYGFAGYFISEPFRFYYWEWVPRCFCSWLVFQKNGGAIASIGNTGLGIGYVDNYWNIGLSGWIMPRFYDSYTNQSKDILGETHDQAIIDYINIVGGVNTDDSDRKTIEEWVLIGDPSLKIGGY
jgi:hypothetical protein